MWIPWAFWALDRAVVTSRLRFGVMIGVFMALQIMSSIFILFFLAILAAYGYAALEQAVRARARPVMAIAVSAVLMLEYWVAPLTLLPYPNSPPPLYAWLATQPRGLVAEFPLPTLGTLPGDEARYAYMSTIHWMPTLNGYSGYYPASYLSALEPRSNLPDDQATDILRRAGVRYVIVHARAYPGGTGTAVVQAFALNPAYSMAATFDGGKGGATLFRVRQNS
ncbi:MAG: hypothetical protein ABIP53_07020 [Candidatus Limnocylindrales bacterium]